MREPCCEAREKHGHALSSGQSRAYNTWSAMRSRCRNKNNKAYHHYGGRGIKVCEEWENSFVSFLGDMGEPPKDMQIDRIDTNGDYSQRNCRWVTSKENNENRKDTVYMTLFGITRKRVEWARRLGIDRGLLKNRTYTLGWTDQKALLTPVKRWLP